MAKKVPASLKDREKSYYKYYAQDIAAAPQEKYDMITPEPGDNAKALRIQDRNDLFLPGGPAGRVWLVDAGGWDGADREPDILPWCRWRDV